MVNGVALQTCGFLWTFGTLSLVEECHNIVSISLHNIYTIDNGQETYIETVITCPRSRGSTLTLQESSYQSCKLNWFLIFILFSSGRLITKQPSKEGCQITSQ